MDEKIITEILEKSQSRVDLYNKIIQNKFEESEAFIKFESKNFNNNFLKINEDNNTLILDIQGYKKHLLNEIK